MSIAALNTLFNDDLNSGIMRILYDFSTTGAADEAPFSEFPSVNNALPIYPAILKSYESGTASTVSADAAYNGGSGVTLYGGVLPQDYEQYLLISGGSDIFSGQEFTFLIEAQKLCKTDFSGLSGDGPIHDREVVFSNLIGTAPNISGWEIGLNSANLMYFKTWDQEQPKTLTFNDVPYGKNLWFVTHEDKNLTVAWFDPAERSIKKNSLTLFGNLSNGGDWYIGSGESSSFSSIDPSVSDAETASVKLNTFAFFDRKFFDGYLSVIGTALKSQDVITTGVTTGSAFDISGVEETCVEVSGVIYSSWVLDHTDYVTGYTTGTEASYSSFTGLVVDGDDYYEYESGNNGYITLTNDSGATITGITGFTYGYPVITGVTAIPVYAFQEVSGVTDENCSISYLFSGETGYTTGVSLSVSGYDASDLFPDTLSYLGPRYEDDFVEIITGNTSYSGDIQILNIKPIVSESSYGQTKTLFVNDADISLTSGDNFFLNGLAQRIGTGSLITGVESGLQTVSLSLQREYAVFPNTPREYACDLAFTGNDEILNLWGVVDVGQPSGALYRQSLVISNTGQYANSPFSEIAPSGKQIFLNGQKIYEGENYLNSGDWFIPTGFVTTCTGIYFSIPDFDGAVNYTGFVSGDGNYDYNGSLFYPKSVVSYINGVREGYSLLLEHSAKRDLITGFGVELTGLSSVFEGSIQE